MYGVEVSLPSVKAAGTSGQFLPTPKHFHFEHRNNYTWKILQCLHQDPQKAVFSTATGYEWTGWGVNFGRDNTFSLLQNHQTALRPVPPPPPINGYRTLLPERSDWCVKLTTHFHLVPRFWVSGSTPPLPLVVFKTCIGTLPCNACTVLHNIYRILRRQY